MSRAPLKHKEPGFPGSVSSLVRLPHRARSLIALSLLREVALWWRRRLVRVCFVRGGGVPGALRCAG